jgi:16S rRNA (guanine966-N2)-methyltransferase
MRIVGGRFGGRTLPGPKGTATRPTAERVREAIASALDARDAIAGAQVLELYAGTGALGFEMVSRGAGSVVFVERDANMAEALRSSAKVLGIAAQAAVLRGDITREKLQEDVLRKGPYTLVLADPPYRDAAQALAIITSLCERGLVAEGAFLLLETAAKDVPSLPEAFESIANYRYGDTAVALFARRGEER